MEEVQEYVWYLDPLNLAGLALCLGGGVLVIQYAAEIADILSEHESAKADERRRKNLLAQLYGKDEDK